MHIEELLLQIYFSLVLGTEFPLTAGVPSYEVKHNKWGKYLHICRFLKIGVLKIIKILRQGNPSNEIKILRSSATQIH